MKTRRARLQVMYESKDISEDLQPYLLGWTYTDNLSGQADDLQLNLEDKDHLWSGSWMPDEGASMTAKIIRENWAQEGKSDSLPLGSFEIDEIEINFPPSTVAIKSISVPESSSLRGQKKNKAWEKTKLSLLAREKANGSGLKLFYESADDPDYDRIEQTEETDLIFLMRLCNDAGLCLKVTGTQLVIFDEEKYEAQAPITTLTKGDRNIKSFRARTTTGGTYRSCHVAYTSPKGKKKISYTYTPPKAPKTGRTLYIYQRVSSVGEAQRLAKKKLREANKNAVSVSMTLMGDVQFVAGVTVSLSGFGKFEGKYIITQATHSQQNGYETAIELRRCLEGY